MWIFIAKAGFFSIVEGDTPDVLLVRARCRDDLVRLRRLYLPQLGQIRSTPSNDYAVRAVAQRDAFAAALAKAVAEITFKNFKNHVADVLGPDRERLYHRVWATMLDLQRERIPSVP